MIIPIGHEDGTVRGVPWVTLGLIIACFVVQLGVRAAGADAERQLEASYTAAVEYAAEHPYLKVDSSLASADELALLARTRSSGVTGNREAEQLRLDELTAAWRADLHRHPLWRGGLVPAEPRLTALFTHMFLHAGWLHLIANMLVLYLAGPFLEDAWGRKLYFGFYLAAGLFAGGMYALLERQLQVPLVGASGAVAGVLGAFLLLRGSSRIRFAVIFGFIGTFTAPAWIMLPLWFVGELLDALAGDVAAAGAGGVAYWAHVWGFLFGLVFAFAVQRRRPLERAIAAVPSRRDARVAKARKLLDRGLYPSAWALLAEAVGCPNPDADALAMFWALAAHLGREDEALPAARELLRRRFRDGEWEEGAALLAQLAPRLAGDSELPALQLRAAEGLLAGDPQAAARLLDEARSRPLPPGLQAKAARLAERLAGGVDAARSVTVAPRPRPVAS
ncbi:MAG TPA: rhomboid family intramembrane serine protease [Thermoanaerobaculia bacterium]|nr:rhomboid family intramembrane serine protease [Thermoanaerobaculia bacterium]